ncbi:MAG: IncA protein [Candidatus Omnitrophica bacterium ADurb.Bin205]|nr:MAG: IncA protein [Candidatus Omnitrophica bacterium ADurb.Bin205]
MNKRASASVPVLLVIILTIILLGSTASGFYLYYNEHLKNIELNNRIEEIITKQKASEAKLLESQRVVSSLELRLKDSTSKIDDLNNQLNLEKASKAAVTSDLESIRAQLQEQNSLRANLESKLRKAEEQLSSMEEKLKDLESKKAELVTKENLEAEGQAEGVELGKILVGPDKVKVNVPDDGDLAKPAEGKVLVVNKEYNFAVISFGSKDGVKLGDIFSIYSGKKYVGDVKVEKLHDSMSAAGFMSEDIKNRVKEGDRVEKKG